MRREWLAENIRIGRRRIPAMRLQAGDVDDIAYQVYNWIRKSKTLLSRDVLVETGLSDDGRFCDVIVLAGGRRVGEFVLTAQS